MHLFVCVERKTTPRHTIFTNCVHACEKFILQPLYNDRSQFIICFATSAINLVIDGTDCINKNQDKQNSAWCQNRNCVSRCVWSRRDHMTKPAGFIVCVRARMREWAAEPPLVRVHTRFLTAVWGDDCWGWWMWFSAKPVRQPMYTGTSQSTSYAHMHLRNSLPDSYRVSPDNATLQRFDGFCAAPHPATCQRVNACAPTSAFNMRPKRSGRPSVFLLSETHVLKEFCRAV